MVATMCYREARRKRELQKKSRLNIISLNVFLCRRGVWHPILYIVVYLVEARGLLVFGWSRVVSRFDSSSVACSPSKQASKQKK